MKRLLIIIAISVLFVSCSLNRFLGLEQPEPSRVAYDNPHKDCIICHAEGDLKSGRIDPTVDYLSICLGCHDYSENHHPVDFRPANESSFPFPLRNGKVTCHYT